MLDCNAEKLTEKTCQKISALSGDQYICGLKNAVDKQKALMHMATGLF
jgi:hypothetical protein